MLTVNEALARILALMQPVGTETVPLQEAAGGVLAADAIANRTQPPFAASAMDGYAVIAADLKTGTKLTVIGEAAAGKRFTGSLSSGQAVRIFTGAPVPEGANHILIQEDTERTENTITLKENRDENPYIRPAGGDFAAGATLSAPKRLTSSDIALLAAMNVSQITVRKRPVIGLIPTGNELVMPGDTPGPDQIISSNNFGLKAMLEACGATARLLPIASDTAQSLAQVFDLALAIMTSCKELPKAKAWISHFTKSRCVPANPSWLECLTANHSSACLETLFPQWFAGISSPAQPLTHS